MDPVGITDGAGWGRGQGGQGREFCGNSAGMSPGAVTAEPELAAGVECGSQKIPGNGRVPNDTHTPVTVTVSFIGDTRMSHAERGTGSGSGTSRTCPGFFQDPATASQESQTGIPSRGQGEALLPGNGITSR